MSRDELAARDEALLEQARGFSEGVLGGRLSPLYCSAWGPQYDPYLILGSTTDPDVFRLCLVNIRIAINPAETWAKCAHCLRLYLVESYGNTCSPECFAAHSHHLDNQQ
jgi:hypothetical protein